jgi:hypothetical protein
MLIKEVPDIMATGDLHRTDIDKYHDIMLISCSCWQSMTAFEEKVGNKPDPCKVPILNLKTFSIKILDFSDPSDKAVLQKDDNELKKDNFEKEIVCKVINKEIEKEEIKNG